MGTTRWQVSGMTCGHCVHSVTEEISALPGVSDVSVDLVPEGVSTVTVTATTDPDSHAISAALDEAGDYQLATV